MVIERMQERGIRRGAIVCAVAFGPGLTLYAVLLRAR